MTTTSDLIPKNYQYALDNRIMQYQSGDEVPLGKTEDGKVRKGYYRDGQLHVEENGVAVGSIRIQRRASN